jgi:hypothetical protein
MADPPLTACPACGAADVEKVFSVPSILVRDVAVRTRSSGNPGLSIDAVPPDFRHPRLRAREVVV